ncbi:hypothetical protein M0R45_013593 [Rubus argutus]|uniref:Uncharacterized protein n=1 Tax=Rubus argutus TaxID=59490 RepID=A0AAW1XMB0_RUBAR
MKCSGSCTRPVEQWERALLRHDSPMLSTCCIFRVPEVLRRQDILAYEPTLSQSDPSPSVIKDLEIPAIRGCYADTLDLDQNSFVEMLILDGCFLVEFFRKAPYPERQDEDDPIFNVPYDQWFILAFSVPQGRVSGSHPIFHILDLIRTALVQDLEVPTATPTIVDDTCRKAYLVLLLFRRRALHSKKAAKRRANLVAY